MKQNAVVLDEVTNGYHNEVSTVLHAEWPLNRFYNTVVDNTPSEDDVGYHVEMFPIESITESNRPTSGICKAMVGQAVVEPDYHANVPDARYYIVDPDDQYKYWQSPATTDESGVFPLYNETNFPPIPEETFVHPYDDLTCVRPQVVYSTEEDEDGNTTPIVITANKINFTVENTFAHPTDYDVQIKTTVSGPWETIASNLPVPSDGKVELWYDGSAWTTTKNLSYSSDLSAVRLVVRAMNRQSTFHLIELGAALERDLTADLSDWNNSMSMGESDFITPLGQVSANTGQVTLWNGDNGTYRNNNEASPYYGILDKGVIFRCWMKYGGQLVPEFEMFSDKWDESDDATSISLMDAATMFMETKPVPVLYENITVQEAIWRTCDIVGFNNYEVTSLDTLADGSLNPDSIIDIFWSDGEKTAWELFSELSRATQTAVYFDSLGVLQVKTRSAAWDGSKESSYEFTRDTTPGGRPSNIVSLNETTHYEANKVTVNWQPTGFSEQIDNTVPFEVVWEPEGTVVLRATELSQNLLVGDEAIHLKPKEGRTWPWKGIMNIEGEYISFDAKRYIYYDGSQRKTAWVSDHDEQKKLDALGGPFHRHLNKYTGALRVEQRGLWGTEEKPHRIDLAGWTKTRRNNHSNNVSPCPGIKRNVGDSSVTISAGPKKKMNDYTYLHRGNGTDVGGRYIGMRMKIDKGSYKNKVGGIFFAADNGLGSGYFLEIMATSKINGKMSGKRKEVMFYSMKPNGNTKAFGGDKVVIKDKSKNSKKNAKVKKDIGEDLAVVGGRYIDFDIWITFGENHRAQIFANGRFLFEAVIPKDSGWQHNNVSRMGLYARGNSSVTFDYVYSINSPGTDMIDSESYYDRISGGYYSSQASDWTFSTRKTGRWVRKKSKKKKNKKGSKWGTLVWKSYTQRFKQRFFDEFGPVAHEVREFDVKFEDSLPVLESKLYFSNTSQAVCTEYVGGVTGGRFIMANISRENAIINGDDEKTSGGQGAINHKLFVYGRPVIQKDAQEIEKVDEWALRRRGPIEVEYASPWIQNEAEADRFSNWLTSHWSRSDSVLEMEVFGNPLIELGDVVNVKYNHIDARFYVIGVTNTFEAGLTTNLTLRKVSGQ